MATPRGADEAAERSGEKRSLRQLITQGILLGSVAFVLLLGAVLHVGPGEADTGEPAEPAVLPLRPSIPLERERPAPRGTDALARRVAQDLERLAAASGTWTAQLALLCDAARARELVADFAGEHQLYLLPFEHDAQACFRICFGDFTSTEQAKAAPGLPAALRELQPHPLPKRIADVLEDME